MEATLRRRRLLAVSAALAAGTAGCQGSSGTPDIKVDNESGRSIALDLRAVRLNGPELLSETVELDDGEETVYDEVVDDGDVRVTADVENGPQEEVVWGDGPDDNSGLLLDIKSDWISAQNVLEYE